VGSRGREVTRQIFSSDARKKFFFENKKVGLGKKKVGASRDLGPKKKEKKKK